MLSAHVSAEASFCTIRWPRPHSVGAGHCCQPSRWRWGRVIMLFASALQAAQRVVIDLAFEGKMTETEVSGMCSALD